jgi:hypothetical protein
VASVYGGSTINISAIGGTNGCVLKSLGFVLKVQLDITDKEI